MNRSTMLSVIAVGAVAATTYVSVIGLLHLCIALGWYAGAPA